MAHVPAPAKQSGLTRLLDRLRRAGESGTHGIVDRLDLATPLGRARLARLTVWAVLAILLLSALAALFTAAHAVRLAARPRASNDAAAAFGPAGWAQAFVSTYVSAGAGRESRLIRFLAQPPAMDGKPDLVRAARTTVAGAREVSPGYWSITIAAEIEALATQTRWSGLGTRYYQVAIAATAEGYIATAPPAPGRRSCTSSGTGTFL